MRTLLAIATVTLLLSLAPPVGALVTLDCTTDRTVVASSFAWDPTCVRIVSGDVITWSSADAEFPHNVRSGQDDLGPFRLLAPACFATTNFNAGESRTVRFTHDSNGVTASLRNADGTWGPVNDCDLARDPTSLASNEAAIPFECGVHPSMTGRVLVARIGGSVG